MMFRQICFSVISIAFLVGCWADLGSGFDSSFDPALLIQASALEESRDRSNRKRNRKSGSYKRSSICLGSIDCEEICEEIFEDYGVVDKCFDLKEDLVFDFEEMLDIFDTDVTYPSLKILDGDVFRDLMELSVEHWVNLTQNIDDSEARAILAWIASDNDVAEVILEYGSTGNYAGFDSYEGLEELMKEVGSGAGCSKYEDALHDEELSGDFTFCDIARKEGNLSLVNRIIDELNDYKECGESLSQTIDLCP